jgi:hypothetical protein
MNISTVEPHHVKGTDHFTLRIMSIQFIWKKLRLKLLQLDKFLLQLIRVQDKMVGWHIPLNEIVLVSNFYFIFFFPFVHLQTKIWTEEKHTVIGDCSTDIFNGSSKYQEN